MVSRGFSATTAQSDCTNLLIAGRVGFNEALNGVYVDMGEDFNGRPSFNSRSVVSFGVQRRGLFHPNTSIAGCSPPCIILQDFLPAAELSQGLLRAGCLWWDLGPRSCAGVSLSLCLHRWRTRPTVVGV